VDVGKNAAQNQGRQQAMAFMLKIQWDIKKDKVAHFMSNQKVLCKVMLEHPGVICYHVDYPSKGVSEWVEIYANDDTFRAHLANEKGKGPLGAIIDDCDKITCRCFGNPDAGTREILAGFGCTYHNTAPEAFVLNPRANKDSPI
jgi:quinol monooxygenase YgiN